MRIDISQARNRGAAGNQYALVMGLIVVLALLSIKGIGGSVSTLLTGVSNRLGAVENASAGGGGPTAPAQPVGGPVYGWGQNNNGQLGDGTQTNQSLPVTVQGLGGRPSIIGIGGYNGCAFLSGTIKCWGRNGSKELGTGTNAAFSLAPVTLTGFSSTPTNMATGAYHSCVTVSGGAQCWGENYHGVLGNGTIVDSASPVNVSGLGGAPTLLAAGFYHNCALVGTAVKCWGNNDYGTMGNGTAATYATSAVTLTGFTGTPSQIAAGWDHSCILSGGVVQCWGWNVYGELGNGTTTNNTAPQTVSLGASASQVATGYYHSCAIVGSALKCWGWNILGQLGNGNTNNASTPVVVSGLAAAPSVLGLGSATSCAGLTNGAVQCWGAGSAGSLGNGATANSNVPVTVTGVTNITQIGIGDGMVLALQ